MTRHLQWPHDRSGQESLSTREVPDALIVGHITRDLTADGGWRPGGAALYAARTASLRGLRVAVVTSASEDVAAAARAALRGVTLRVIASAESTTFENVYAKGARWQYLRAMATSLRRRDIPDAWQGARISLLAPVAEDFRPSIAGALHGATIGLAPQGWLRAKDAQGRVRPRALTPSAAALLSACAAVILSREDLTGPDATPAQAARAEKTLKAWATKTRLLVVTCGREGAELWRDGGIERFPAFPAREVDPTGAGDVFAMTFLCALAATGSAQAAIVEANQVAACSVEGYGIEAIPRLDEALAR